MSEDVGQPNQEVNLLPKYITPASQFDSASGPPRKLYDANGYTVIAAVFKGESRSRLAQSCEGYSPPIRGCPTGWHVVPKFLEIPLLHALLDEVLTHGEPANLIYEELKIRMMWRYRELNP